MTIASGIKDMHVKLSQSLMHVYIIIAGSLFL